ncbi:MAG: hypothetical protein AB9900_07985 [Humidesulfovibrio sp.]
MLGMLKTLEDTFAAMAFANAGERQEAMQMAGVKETTVSVSDVYAAVAFAEVGCVPEARELLGLRPARLVPTPKVCGFLESVGLSGVHVAYGLAEA